MLRRTACAALLALLALSVSADSAQAPDTARFKEPTPPILLEFDIGWTAGVAPLLPAQVEVLGTNISVSSVAGVDPVHGRATLMGEPGGAVWFDVPFHGFAVLAEVRWSCAGENACPMEATLGHNETGSGVVARTDMWTTQANGSLRLVHTGAAPGAWTLQLTQVMAGVAIDGEVRVSLFVDGWIPADYSAFA